MALDQVIDAKVLTLLSSRADPPDIVHPVAVRNLACPRAKLGTAIMHPHSNFLAIVEVDGSIGQGPPVLERAASNDKCST